MRLCRMRLLLLLLLFPIPAGASVAPRSLRPPVPRSHALEKGRWVWHDGFTYYWYDPATDHWLLRYAPGYWQWVATVTTPHR